MTTVVNVVIRRGLIIDAYHTNQPNKSKLGSKIRFNHLKQSYICIKMLHFICKGGCTVCGHYIDISMYLKRRKCLIY